MIIICLSLISLTGGLMLLAQTKKESLGKLFSVFAVLIILSSIATLGCGICHTVCRMHCQEESCMPPMCHPPMPGACQMPTSGQMPDCGKKAPADSTKIDDQNQMGDHPVKGK
jgi:hypothetical protein